MENKKIIFFIIQIMLLISIITIFKPMESYATSKISIQYANVTLSSYSFTYNGQAKKPTVKSIKVKGKTVPSSEYNVRYVNNVNVGTGGIIISGKGKYTGTIAKEFTINKKNISNLNTQLNLSSAYTYDGKEKRPGITLYVDGRKLENNKDFKIEYYNNVNVGTGTAKFIGINNYTGSFSRTFKIEEDRGGDIIEIAKKIDVYMANNGYVYDTSDIGILNNTFEESKTGNHICCCATYVWWVLKDAGYLNENDVNKYSSVYGWASVHNANHLAKIINYSGKFKTVNQNEIKAGDIIWYDEHIEIATDKDNVYSAGSTDLIKNANPTARDKNRTIKAVYRIK